jgi:acyl-CoA thioesterase I
LRTLSRLFGACALGIGFWVIALQAAASNRTILVFGDSLSAGYGLRPEQGWVALLDKRLLSQGYGYKVVNASVSGETTTGGLQRLPRALESNRPDLVVLELGSNDALRGLPLSAMQSNLGRMIELAQQASARVLLIGMRMPPNYGPRYTADFAQVFASLRDKYHVPLVPFLLQSVALDPSRMQEDGLHPNALGEPIMLDTVWPQLEPMLKRNP